jgi:hypothetical protein
MGARDEGLDVMAELDAIVDLGRRGPGSDAERRAAQHLQQRLEELGRTAETEPLAIYPAWPLAYALLAAAAVVASVLAVDVPIAGVALAFAAALLTFLDAGLGIPTVRRLLGRRASQNVVSWGDVDKPGAIVIVAHYDAGRAGLAHSDRAARVRAAVSGLLRRPIGPLRLVFWAELGVLACSLMRLAGLDGTALTAVQFVPTIALIVAIALLTDVALAGTRAGENDNASGTVLVLRLAERLGTGLEHFGVHVLFAGAGKAGAAGIGSFIDRHDLVHDSTVLINVDQVGSGAVRYTRREGALVTLKTHPQLRSLCEGIDDDALSIVNRAVSNGSAATGKGFAAITVTCRDRLDYASGRVDENTLERAEAFVVELIERLDAELGPSIVAPVEATALSEPD